MTQTIESSLQNPFVGWTTLQEAARIIGRDKMTVRGWANKGWITTYPIGPKIRLANIDEVKAFAQRAPTPRPRSVDKTKKKD